MGRLSKVKILAMDVDGTLTDGGMIFLGDEQVKVFNVYDGLGIRLALNHGLRIAWITGNTSRSVTGRAQTLGVEDVYQSSWVKSTALKDLRSDLGKVAVDLRGRGSALALKKLTAELGVALAVDISVEGFEVSLVTDIRALAAGKKKADFTDVKVGVTRVVGLGEGMVVEGEEGGIAIGAGGAEISFKNLISKLTDLRSEVAKGAKGDAVSAFRARTGAI